MTYQEIHLSQECLKLYIFGKKKTIIKYGIREYYIGKSVLIAGGLHVITEITDISYCKYRDLTEQNAIDEGFTNLEDLLQHICKVYPSIESDSDLTIATFAPF